MASINLFEWAWLLMFGTSLLAGYLASRWWLLLTAIQIGFFDFPCYPFYKGTMIQVIHYKAGSLTSVVNALLPSTESL